MGSGGPEPAFAKGALVKVLAVLLMIVGLAVIIVPQYTNCEYGRDQPATINMKTSDADSVRYASMGSMEAAAEAAVPYRMMKCLWSARAEIIAGVPLFALGALLLFARRKETIRVIGILTTLIGVLTILIPTNLVGTCVNPAMVCNTQMKPTLLICGGIAVALGIAVLVLGEMRRPTDGPAEATAAA
jgi:uncharacterized membrane protein YeiB